MPFTVAGTVTIAGTPAPDASDVVAIWAYDGADDGDLISVVDITGGTGAFTCDVPDNTRDYFAIYDDGVYRGVSAVDTPSGSADWTVDATSVKGVPADGTEWTALLTDAGISSGNPTSTWLMQEASGNLADAIASNTFTAFGSAGYQQTIAGWTRKAITFSDGGAASFYNVSIGNTTTTSILILAYVAVTSTPAATRDVLYAGTSTATRDAQVTTGPVYRVIGAGGQATGTGGSNPSTTIRPVVLQINRTGTAIRLATDQECIEPSYTAPAGGGATLQIGDSGAGSPACAYVYAAYFSGAAAEMSKANIKALLQSLGWTIPWS